MVASMDCFGSTEYQLLNKDSVLAGLVVDGFLDRIEVKSREVELPFWMDDLGTFVANRRAPKNRENIEQLLKDSGCNNLAGFLSVTHALSMTDTFWVREKGSSLTWDNVSLYRNQFNEVIARTAFDGGLYGGVQGSTSPEYGTDGTFAKCWIREDEQIKLLKRGSSGARNAGREPFSEFYAWQIVRAFTGNCVEYGLREWNGRLCSVCDAFTSEERGFLPYSVVESKSLDFVDVLKNYEQLTGSSDFAKMMFVVDAVIMNEDRHKNNFGFIVDNDRCKIVGAAPLFDHNLALLPYAELEDFDDVNSLLERKGPVLGSDWIKTAAYCLMPDTKRVLESLHGFKFERHPDFNLPDWKLEALESLVTRNVEDILRVAKLLGK